MVEPNWMPFRKKPVQIWAYVTDKEQIIHTLEGDHLARKGDYIIRGVRGELYPCKPDIFLETYEYCGCDDVADLYREGAVTPSTPCSPP